MRHGKKINPLGRKAAHRKAMLSNMACSLIEHKRIKTTVAKAKALRKFVEPLITKSKNDTTHSRRIVFSHLRQKHVVTELFGDVALKVASREGGYTRILRLGNRLGDNAEMCFIELVDFNDLYTNEKPKKSKSTRRSRGGSKKSQATSEVEANTTEVEATASEVESNTSEDSTSVDVQDDNQSNTSEQEQTKAVDESIEKETSDEEATDKNEQDIQDSETNQVDKKAENKEDKSA